MDDLNKLKRELFGSDFKWGVSTAAYQIEGASDADGKGASIWDVFTAKKKKVFNGDTGKIACDFYNRYREDIQLIKALNIPNFRFSVAWPRVLPSGVSVVNSKGIDFYNRVIDYCLELGIEPWLTLYHWDLPQQLEEKGGWTNRDIISWFSDYAALCALKFGDRVKNWMVMNEPAVFTGAGYFFGIHAPGRTGLKNFLPAVHHVSLSMAEGGRRLREILPHASIGTTFSCSYIEPYSDKSKDVEAARRADALINRLFIEPVLGLGYPVEDIPVLRKMEKWIKPGDENRLAFNFDFIGLQNYTREIVRFSFFTPYLKARLVAASKRNVPLTSMKWEIFPTSIYHILKKFSAYPQIKSIIITENGAAFPDFLINNQVNDIERTSYLKQHISQVLKARQEGCCVDGYFIWTLTDNFEWAEGYRPRFGLVYIDFETQKRTVKSSGYWYAQFLNALFLTFM